MNSLGGPGGLKKPKGKIRPPMKPTLQTPLSETWDRLSAAIREIQRHNSSKLSYEEQYRYAYNMVLYKQGDQLYSGVKVLISDHLLALARSLIVPTFPRAPLVPALPTARITTGMSGSSGSSPTPVGEVGAGTTASAASAPAEVVGSSSSSGGGGGGEGMSAVERGQEGERFLKAVKGVWDDHISCMGKIRDVLKYMDKVWTPAQKPQLPLIYDAGLTLFLVKIIRSAVEPIHEQLVSTLLSQIRLEREGEVINRSAVRDVVQILLNLSDRPGGPSVYELDFEAGFLAWTAAFYQEEGERLVEDLPAGEYLRRTERRLEEEASRTSHYLSNQTSAALQKILHDYLLTAHLETVLTKAGSGLVPMVDGDKIDDLARLYRLFSLVPTGLKELRQHLKDDVRRRGEKINAAVLSPASTSTVTRPADGDEATATTGDAAATKGKAKAKEAGGGSAAATALQIALRWVQEVLDLKDKLDHLLVGGFAEDRKVQTSINEAFELFINANPKSAEYISLFIDDNLKKGLKGKSEEEVDVVLDKTITLFRFLTDKDVFERYYKNHLSKRLINNRSVSDDAERGMVAKLKIECGYQFTQKLEGMFMDIRVSTDTMDMYKSHVAQTSQQPPFELAVTVLTATFWPGVSQKQLASFPPALAERCAHFEKFYLSRHSGRRLTWQTGQGTADVRVRFKARTHELNVSTLALIVLLLFEELDDGEELSYEDIQAATQIPHAELARTLQSLACGKYRVLTKFPKGREVAPTDSFTFNDAFTAPLAKIKIAMVASKVETTEERSETNDKVMEDRRHMIEACIVRIMKSSKRLKHSDLLQEVIKQLAPRFAPTPSDIKKRIEALIERDYLDREADLKTYNYLA